MRPYAIGGVIKQGRVLVAIAGTEMVLTNGLWTDIGELTDPSAGNFDPTAITSVRNIETSITFQQLPPKTRRDKRNRNAFMRVLWGDMLPAATERRQLIHNGRKA
jgi:hypothetical protein